MSSLAAYARAGEPRCAVFGACTAGAALSCAGTPVGGLLWTAALVFACIGFGRGYARLTRRTSSFGMSAVIGFACLLVLSTLIARLGLLGRTVQIAVALAGVLACAIPGCDASAGRPGRPALIVFALGLGALLVVLVLPHYGIEWTHLSFETPRPQGEFRPHVAFMADGTNHVFLVKRLLDTGSMGLVHHQLGAQIVGESYAALVPGAHMVAIFDAGLCPALLLLLLASEVAGSDDDLAIPMFAMLGLGITFLTAVVSADATPWAPTLLLVASYLALRRAVEDRRHSITVLVLALALVALRYEYLWFALPLAGAGFVMPRTAALSRRTLAILLAVWLVSSVILQLVASRSAPLGEALVNAGEALLVIPFVAGSLWLLGRYTWRSALAATGFAILFFVAATWLDILPQALQSAAGLTASAYALTICLLLAIGEAPPGAPARFHLVPAVLSAAIWIASTLPLPTMADEQRTAIQARFIDAFVALRDLHNRYPLDESDRLRELQDKVPAGARIGFWGQNPARLDFRRNKITDVSWPVEARFWRAGYLNPIAPKRLAGIEYLLLESLQPGRNLVPQDLFWGSIDSTPTHDVDTMLEPIADVGPARLYKVRR